MLKQSSPRSLVANPFVKGFLLVVVKEVYVFLRNLYGLVFHPFKTIVNIRRKPDWSQTILIFGLPAYLLFLVLILFIPAWWLFKGHELIRPALFLLFLFSTLLIFLFAGYLLFWAVQYLWRCKLKLKRS